MTPALLDEIYVLPYVRQDEMVCTQGWTNRAGITNLRQASYYGDWLSAEQLEGFAKLLLFVGENFTDCQGFFFAQGEDGTRNIEYVLYGRELRVRATEEPLIRVSAALTHARPFRLVFEAIQQFARALDV